MEEGLEEKTNWDVPILKHVAYIFLNAIFCFGQSHLNISSVGPMHSRSLVKLVKSSTKALRTNDLHVK